MSKASSAVLCLSHELNNKNNLSIESVDRLKASSELYDRYDCKYFITTGWQYKKDLHCPLSTIMAEYAINNLNIHKESIFEEPLAKDTVGEAYFIKRNFFQAHVDINQLIVVTSDWHLERAKEIFQFMFSEIDDPKLYFHAVSGDIAYHKKEDSNSSIYAFREMAKLCKKGDLDDIYSKMLQHHHLYND